MKLRKSIKANLLTFLALIIATSCNESKKEEQEEIQEETTEEVIPMGDNSQVSLDWNGTYSGILPCNDCAGTQTELILNNDGTYEYYEKPIGKGAETKSATGTIKWDNGSYITLDGVENSPKWMVQEGRLVQVDEQNNKIETEDMGAYVLMQKNSGANTLNGTYWKLIELNGKLITDNDYQNEPYLLLQSNGNTVFGNSGCNTYRGTYTTEEGNKLAFSEMASTRMACAKDKVEVQFLENLNKSDNYAISGDTLSLNKAKMAPLAKFKAVSLKQ